MNNLFLLLFVLVCFYFWEYQENYQSSSPGTTMQLVLRNKEDDILLADAFQAKPYEATDQGLLGGIGYSAFNPMGYRRGNVKNYYQKRLSKVGH